MRPQPQHLQVTRPALPPSSKQSLLLPPAAYDPQSSALANMHQSE
jgi:hypothetical protein